MQIRILIISVICLLTSVYVSAQVKWIGAGDGTSWNDAANWSTGLVPAATDDVVLDNSTVTTSYTVNLPSGSTTVTVSSIEITPNVGNTIQLILPAGNTSPTGLVITSAADALVVNAGGSFINASGSDIEVDGNLVIGSGGTIDVSSGAGSLRLSIKGNISITGPATSAITESGTGNPIIELNGNGGQTITSAAGALTGNNLDVVVSTTGTVSLLSSVFLPHGLTVEPGAIVDISNAASNFTLGIKGDLVVNGTITESGSSTLSRILLNGTSNQNITMGPGGSITGDALDFRLSNTAGGTLLSDLVLPFSYTIAGGNLSIGNFSLTMALMNITGVPKATNHVIINGTGHVTIVNIGLQTRTFYIGIDATSINEVSIQDGSDLDYSIRVDPGINPAITKPFAAVNRTWIIETNSAAANPHPANVSFYYYDGQGGSQFNYTANVDVAQNIMGIWNIISSNIPTSQNPPEYRATLFISSFNTPFIVGIHGAILPIDFSIVCKAEKKENSALINWRVYSEDNVDHYEVEQAINGSAFKTIQTIMPGNSKPDYSYEDNNLPGGTSIYRIKVVLLDGKIRYSNSAAVLFNTKAFVITSVAPNPLRDNGRLTISSPENTTVKMFLYDLQGRVVRQWQQPLAGGTNIISLEAARLKPGVYLLSATDGSVRTNTYRILKQ